MKKIYLSLGLFSVAILHADTFEPYSMYQTKFSTPFPGAPLGYPIDVAAPKEYNWNDSSIWDIIFVTDPDPESNFGGSLQPIKEYPRKDEGGGGTEWVGTGNGGGGPSKPKPPKPPNPPYPEGSSQSHSQSPGGGGGGGGGDGKDDPISSSSIDAVAISPSAKVSSDDNGERILHLNGGFLSGGAFNTISLSKMILHLSYSNALYSMSPCNKLYVSEIFQKSGDIDFVNDKWIAQSDWLANCAIASKSPTEPLSVELSGDTVIEDLAENRTSFISFGGNDMYGMFSAEKCLEELVMHNVWVRNQIVYIATNSDAVINGDIIFEEPLNERHAILVLNCDNGPQASHVLQTVKVRALYSSDGDGVITTRTGSQYWREIDPLSEEGENATPEELMNGVLVGDDTIREGILEIYAEENDGGSDVGDFYGAISDNLSPLHTRGKVNVIMNAPGFVQALGGVNRYTGYTKIMAGTLRLNVDGYHGTLILQGGNFEILNPDNPVVYNLNWSSGGWKIDFSGHAPITLSGNVSISAMPEALDTFNFSAITAGTHTLFNCDNASVAFANFVGKTIEYADADNPSNEYLGTFTVVGNSLKITFTAK